ncbi:hypothetical protein KFU94_51045 [Chloroflexi bacterium TSY]|nr:hypothetical protein [Chloroflexi bacterium TSY]
MSAYDPEKLLSKWKQQELTVEMAMGHVLQNLAKQQEAQVATATRSRQLQGTLNQHQSEIQALRADVIQMQTAIDHLATRMTPLDSSNRKEDPPHDK